MIVLAAAPGACSTDLAVGPGAPSDYEIATDAGPHSAAGDDATDRDGEAPASFARELESDLADPTATATRPSTNEADLRLPVTVATVLAQPSSDPVVTPTETSTPVPPAATPAPPEPTTPSARPTASATPSPKPTIAPQTPTASPTAPATVPTAPPNTDPSRQRPGPSTCVVGVCPGTTVSCTVSNTGPIAVGAPISMQARIAPAAYDQDIEWFIHHGDGYVDTGSFSQGQYLSPGFYTVKAEWRSQGQTGWVGCGTVTVGINDGLAPVFDASAYIGLTEQEAESRAAAERRTIRVIRVDGNYNSYTDDIVPGRIDVEIDNGVITRVS